MIFKTEEEAEFWREAYLAFVQSPKQFDAGNGEASPSANADNAV